MTINMIRFLAKRLALPAAFYLVVASVSADNVVPLYSFGNGNDGAGPWGGLVEASDGNLYGTTTSGGIYHTGTVFRISKSSVFTSLYSFTGGADSDRSSDPLPVRRFAWRLALVYPGS